MDQWEKEGTQEGEHGASRGGKRRKKKENEEKEMMMMRGEEMEESGEKDYTI